LGRPSVRKDFADVGAEAFGGERLLQKARQPFADETPDGLLLVEAAHHMLARAQPVAVFANATLLRPSGVCGQTEARARGSAASVE